VDERDQIRDRVDLAELIGEYIPLQKAGGNFKANCPFHREKTPSFMVSPAKQIWHCFGCGKGGDAFTWLMEKEGMEFPEALRTLGKRVGIEIKPRNPQIWSQKNKLYEINNLSARYFHEAFWKSREGETARRYMKERQFTKEILDKFSVGYSPDSWDILSKGLAKKGYDPADIFAAGLTVKKDQGGYYDRFRGRLMFPIKNIHGDVVAFGARQLRSEDKGAKYINTPETDIYHKSWVMYGLSDARADIRKQDRAIIVEGYTDVLASWQVGVTNVVASSGTALTEGHLELLKRYTKNLILSFDMDLAGDLATKRGIEMALGRGFNLQVAKLPAGKDPADVALFDKVAWQKVFSHSQPIMKFFFSRALQGRNPDQLEDKKKIVAELLPHIKSLENEVERHHYVGELAMQARMPEETLTAALQKLPVAGRERVAEVAASFVAEKPSSEIDFSSLEARFIGLLLKLPAEMEYVLDNFDANYLGQATLKRIYLLLEKFYNTNQTYTAESFSEHLKTTADKVADNIPTLLLAVEKDFTGEDIEVQSQELRDCIFHLEKQFVKKRMQELSQEFKRAEAIKDSRALADLSAEFTRLTNQLREAEKQISRR
jgi:DNA primase